MSKRILAVYLFMIGCAATLFFRIYYLSSGDYLKTAAQNQSSYTLETVSERGTIYDSSFRRLTNAQSRYIAAVMPCSESLAAMSVALSGEAREKMIKNFENNRPFLVEVDSPDIYSYGVDVFEASRRYLPDSPAPHIIGHLSDGTGAYGIERAYDEILADCGAAASITYTVDARGVPLRSTPPVVSKTASGEGVVLTLDADIQRLAEETAAMYMKRGAVVVMDVRSGDIIASVSLPRFDPENVAASINSEDSPFVNRAFSAFNVGSTFKLATAACALDSGISEEVGFDCTGAITINGVRFGCHNHAGHGWLTMQRAMEQSCNPYYIMVGQKLEPQSLITLCEGIGFSRRTKLAPGMFSAAGTLSTPQALVNRAEMANFSFGQGQLTATPLQIAQMLACVANGGQAVTPRLVLGATKDGVTLSEENGGAVPARVMSTETAAALKRMLIATVEQGSGADARPDLYSAGGKTGSAQTGLFSDNGVETVHAWFSGFYPAQNPKYAIVVLNEGGSSGGKVAAPVFRKIANGIEKLGKL